MDGLAGEAASTMLASIGDIKVAVMAKFVAIECDERPVKVHPTFTALLSTWWGTFMELQQTHKLTTQTFLETFIGHYSIAVPEHFGFVASNLYKSVADTCSAPPSARAVFPTDNTILSAVVGTHKPHVSATQPTRQTLRECRLLPNRTTTPTSKSKLSAQT